MTRRVIVVRPEPGNAATCARAAAAGLGAVALPLFEVVALPWSPPDASAYDALLLTSANTLRHGGRALDRFQALPVLAVGETTAGAARAAGFEVVATGTNDAAGLIALAAAAGVTRALHLGGRDRGIAIGGPVCTSIAVYASEAVPVAPALLAVLENAIVLLHSARAARRVGTLVDAHGPPRGSIRIAALSAAITRAARPGWDAVAIAVTPSDAALLAAANALVD